MKSNKSHIEKIQCPECGLKQFAVVEHTLISNLYIHTCQNRKCKHVITKTEWHQVK